LTCIHPSPIETLKGGWLHLRHITFEMLTLLCRWIAGLSSLKSVELSVREDIFHVGTDRTRSCVYTHTTTCPPFPFASTTLRLPLSACFAGNDLFSLLLYIIITPSGQITLVFHYIFYAPLVNRRSSSVFQRRIKCLCFTARPHYKILPLLFASTVSCRLYWYILSKRII